MTGLIAALPTSTSTLEIRFACPDPREFEVVADVARRLRMAGAEIVDIDGVRVNIGAAAGGCCGRPIPKAR